MIRIFYDNDGNILNQYSDSKYAPAEGSYIDIPQKIKISDFKVDIMTKELVALPPVEYKSLHELKASVPRVPITYKDLRQEAYGPLSSQLDTLWHDIDAGKFGDVAKTSAWYQNISAVKSEIPKA
jgi:hypothetical protein